MAARLALRAGARIHAVRSARLLAALAWGPVAGAAPPCAPKTCVCWGVRGEVPAPPRSIANPAALAAPSQAPRSRELACGDQSRLPGSQVAERREACLRPVFWLVDVWMIDGLTRTWVLAAGPACRPPEAFPAKLILCSFSAGVRSGGRAVTVGSEPQARMTPPSGSRPRSVGPARSCVTGPWDRPADVALILDSRAILRPTSQGEEAQPARGQWSRLQHQGACPLCCLQSRLLRLGPRFPWSLEPGSHRLGRHPLQRAGGDGGSGAGKAAPGGGWVLHVPSAAWQGQ
ncbi:uncharacterized protein LOC125120546 isoform X2 [Phacochoerus africanus]|uniref:uncharacterized protein LOC125120546 isoform X2 n=1 Tax=Phacochoerus africanus TaxID=41426 RepID=UPI001FD872E8|nr:uncharacterized protein LOC125120546 isoform X2 [Phacochoerus africanus]